MSTRTHLCGLTRRFGTTSPSCPLKFHEGLRERCLAIYCQPVPGTWIQTSKSSACQHCETKTSRASKTLGDGDHVNDAAPSTSRCKRAVPRIPIDGEMETVRQKHLNQQGVPDLAIYCRFADCAFH